MKDILHRFIGILKIELEDLEEDIDDLLELCQRQKNSKEITNYVYLENKSLLLNEIAGIKSLINSLDTWDARKFESKEEMFQEIDRMVHARTRECAFPEAVYSLVKRRLDKVVQYLMQ
jgi:hypothetical protein